MIRTLVYLPQERYQFETWDRVQSWLLLWEPASDVLSFPETCDHPEVCASFPQCWTWPYCTDSWPELRRGLPFVPYPEPVTINNQFWWVYFDCTWVVNWRKYSLIHWLSVLETAIVYSWVVAVVAYIGEIGFKRLNN